MTGDAHHIAAPTEDGAGPGRAMLAAIGERDSRVPVASRSFVVDPGCFQLHPTFWGESTWD